MKKNIASIANDTMNATMLAPRKVRERKNLKSTIGALERSQLTTQPTITTTASTSSDTVLVLPQCQRLPSTRASTSAVSPIVMAAIPGKSTDLETVSSRDS